MRSVFVLALPLLLVSCSSDPAPGGGGSGDAGTTGGNTVTLVDNQFSPAVLNVKVGDTVTWTWKNGVHDVKSGPNCTADGKFDSGPAVAAPKTFSFKFDTPGSFEYYCTPHCAMNMKGTIVVK
jgi:plastocyanin